MELWIPFTIAAAFFQNLRSACQKHLKGKLSTNGAAYSRFIYALPVIAIYVWLLNLVGNFDIPQSNSTFILYCIAGGICQIMFTVFLIWMFSYKSFAVGTVYSKLEIVTVAVFGSLLLGDTLNIWASLAIALSALGIVALSIGQQKLALSSIVTGLRNRTTAIGLACAAWLGGSVVFFRGAALALNHSEFIMGAAYALLVSLVIQSTLMGGYLLVREPGEFQRVVREWRWAGAAGFTGALASIGWFSAFALQNASYVRAVGQIELVFTFLITLVFFKEKVNTVEITGAVLISGGILVLLLLG